MDEEAIIMYGLTEGQCGLLTILYEMGPQENNFFKENSVKKLIDSGYITLDLKNQIISITDEGIKIGKEVSRWKLHKMRIFK